jgi:hypothetical protein
LKDLIDKSPIPSAAVDKPKSSRKSSGSLPQKVQRAKAQDKPPERSSTELAQSADPNIALTLKHFEHRRERSLEQAEGKRLYLRVGDEVNHLRFEEWGIGVVMEVMTSSVPGGTCLARIRFQDGQLRCFNNDMDNESCCYYFGVRRYWNPTHGVDAIRAKFFMRG